MARDPISTGSDTAKGIASSAAVAAQATLASSENLMNAFGKFGDAMHKIQERHDNRQAFLKQMKMAERKHALDSKKAEAEIMAIEHQISRENSLLSSQIELNEANAKNARNQGYLAWKKGQNVEQSTIEAQYGLRKRKEEYDMLAGMSAEDINNSKKLPPEKQAILKEKGLLPPNNSNAPANTAALPASDGRV